MHPWSILDKYSFFVTILDYRSYYSKAKLEDFVAELLDYFYYLHDIFNQRMSLMSEVLCVHLLECLLLPQFVKSLIPKREQEQLSKYEDIVNIAHIPPEYSDLDVIFPCILLMLLRITLAQYLQFIV